MTTRDDGGNAFPISIPGVGDNGAGGMSLRDWFAGQALVGVALHDDAYHWSPEGIAVRAYRIADAMLAARKTEGE